jgi:putative ABC transport system permease protein
VLGPVVARPAAALIGAPQAARRGMSGSLARRNAMRNPKRTAGTATALLIGVAVVALFTVVGASIKQSLEKIVDEQFAGDLIVEAEDFGVGGLSVELAPEVAALPEVDAVTAAANGPMRLNGDDVVASSADPATIEPIIDPGVREGSLADVRPDQIAVSGDFAKDNGLALGDAVDVLYPDGAGERPTVAAIYDEVELMGDVVVHRDAFRPHTSNPGDFVVLVSLADGVSETEGELAVQAVADRHASPDVQTRDEFMDSVAGQVDTFLNVIYVMLILAIVIALMGIANTLSLSIHERTRELGLLRAVGQSRRQLRSMVRGEALVVALFGTVGGVGLGVFLAWAMVRALAEEDLDVFAVPTTSLAIVLALGALVGVVAAVRPARRAARMDVLAAIATE